jgi:hypothetical protein
LLIVGEDRLESFKVDLGGRFGGFREAMKGEGQSPARHGGFVTVHARKIASHANGGPVDRFLHPEPAGYGAGNFPIDLFEEFSGSHSGPSAGHSDGKFHGAFIPKIQGGQHPISHQQSAGCFEAIYHPPGFPALPGPGESDGKGGLGRNLIPAKIQEYKILAMIEGYPLESFP